jgi:uncharacterized RDD family membrane protein YckC
LSTSSSLQSSDSPEAIPLWKQEVNERLAAHRTRRPRKAEDQARLPLDIEPGESRSSQVAARVAARYAKVPSYSQVLAEEARNAAQVAHAAAEDAMVAAQAVLDGMRDTDVEEPIRNTPAPPRQNIAAQKTPFHPESASRLSEAFVEEIVEPIETIAGNLIEFPREIVAPRKARPRLAEGPLREESVAEAPQLRIFEVDTETISKTPVTEHSTPEWSSIRLDARSAEHIETDPSLVNYLDVPMKVASMGDRLMAGLVDLSLAGLAFLVFVLVFVACTAHPPIGKPALAAAGGTLVFFFLLYQFLFFTYSEATPGMRYARIALCTFEDENPTRSQMRNRIGAILLSACTLGMGFAWVFFDEDGLGWHDRLSHTYQRSYR